jgi:hypothetical protein
VNPHAGVGVGVGVSVGAGVGAVYVFDPSKHLIEIRCYET